MHVKSLSYTAANEQKKELQILTLLHWIDLNSYHETLETSVIKIKLKLQLHQIYAILE